MEFNFNFNEGTVENKAVQLDADKIYDVLILGGGPAAQTAAVYCMRKGVTTGIITKNFGGQVAETSDVENYMGYTHINGPELMKKFREQVEQFEISVLEGYSVTGITAGKIISVSVDNGKEYRTKSLIISTGKSWRKLNVPGEVELTGKGVAYCSICDAPLFKGKKVIVVGGGNSGLESALDLAKAAEFVTLVQFLPELTADRILIDKFEEFQNKKIIFEHEVVEIHGKDRVDGVSLKNRKTGTIEKTNADGIFIEIGLVPNTAPFKGIIPLNEIGEIIVDCACRTGIDGIFAAGDVTSVPFKQIVISAGEGAKAALSACEYILSYQN
jgi:alkyl hydroperoxide reductase subunit F